MKKYLKALSLWEVIENDAGPATLPPNPTLIQLKKHEEDLAKKLCSELIGEKEEFLERSVLILPSEG